MKSLRAMFGGGEPAASPEAAAATPEPRLTQAPEEGLVEHWGHLPSWWRERNNIMLAPEGAVCPDVQAHPGLTLPSDSRVVIRSPDCGLTRLILWNAGAIVEIGAAVEMASGTLSCEGGATIRIEGPLNTGPLASFDARNGGSIVIEGEGLWSANVQVVTDDMHAIRDVATGERVNRRGSDVRVGRHVWIGQEVIVLAGSSIGADSIVGARSVVSGEIPPNVAAVGSPARVVRSGVTWTYEDLP